MDHLTLDEYHARLQQQGVPREHLAFKCPACNTVQSATDLIKAGAGEDFTGVWKYLGFSCVGRFSKDKKPAKGCDWTLGGLFRIHTVEVADEDGVSHMMFEIASPGEAQAHARKNGWCEVDA